MSMDKPFAITLDPGSSLANKTGAGAPSGPVYVDRLPPATAPARPGEDIQGWLYHAEGRRLRGRLAPPDARQPVPAVMGRVCYHLRRRLQPRPARRGGHQLGRTFLARRGAEARLGFEAPPAESGQARAGGRRRALGLSAAYHLRRLGHARDGVEAGPLPAA